MKSSVIICYTNVEQYQQAVEYIEAQTIASEVEIIGVDNSGKKFSSASKALNYGASVAIGEVLVFMHQDLFLLPTNALENIYEYLISQDVPTLVGIAGAKKGTFEVYSAITETEKDLVRYNHLIDAPTSVECLDECLIAMRKTHWESAKFDEVVCDDWHLYGVDMSIATKLRGGQVVCLPIKARHMSCGTLSMGFYKSLKKLIKKYRGKIDYIYTTCVTIKVSMLSINIVIMKIKARKAINSIKALFANKR